MFSSNTFSWQYENTNILLRKHPKTRRITIRIQPFRGVIVSLPLKTSLNTAKDFVIKHRSWLDKNLNKIKIIESKQNALAQESIDINHTDAKNFLQERTKAISEKLNFSYNKIFIRRQKTLWGSCSARNNINLNAALYLLPQELIDYVIIHELVHTKIRNHKKEFWQSVASFVPEALSLRRKLREYQYLIIK